ncbi:lantibiotic dehydratase family protein [Actinophytocola gossypii]|uniref:Lantibiotic dehydratase n=1 Tax=Actinophytocola gossypii TaxID=2812003 RepID=A0ABT2J219_9PSEU|nr:lantibiotic dehydratase family protein [Actinophytocola gossypii]MCT2581901.1 lantibiotic dehydratase [Actinophytocola gossypii]
MRADGQPAGPAGLLRVAAVPAAVLARAGNPDLFDRIRDRQRSEVDYIAFAARLAARLTGELVPHPELPGPVRGLAVATRRTLLRGHPVDEAACRRLAVVNAALDGPDGLTGELLRAAAWSRDLRAEDRRLDNALTAERARLATLPWDLVTGCPAALRAVTDAAPHLPAEIATRLVDDPAWAGKRMRQRADYLLRLLARAAGKTTPRGWFGHVALVQAGPGAADRLLVDARVGDHAVHVVDNIGAHRRDLAAGDALPDASLSMTPLHWVSDDRLCCWVPDPDNPVGTRCVRVRRTPAVEAVRHALGTGAVRTREVVALLAAGDESRTDVARDFLHHLVRLGIVQASTRPTARLLGWTAEPKARPQPERSGFVDVYRRGGGHVPVAALGRLGDLVAQAGRVQALLTRPVAAHPVLDLVDAHPRPVTELVARFLDGRHPSQPDRRHPAWPEPEPGTAYQRLCDWLGEHAGHEEVDITAAVLDRIGAPAAAPRPWPVDCLVRPLPDGKPFAVLEAVLPAGVADARFADALRALHADMSHVDDYRSFADEVAARCGVELVEVLVPPQGARGANTVRRPRYTPNWTGDADLSTYLAGDVAGGRFLPLGQITVRRDGGRMVAEDPAGRPLWPVCHATRVPPSPWDVVLALLTSAAPVGELASPFVAADHTTAFPGRERVPRIVVDGGLVLAPRSVVVARDRLPRADLPFAARVRELARLRTATGAPRWNFLRADGAGRARPVDLDGIAALRALDRLLADPAVTSVVLEEMLPAPEHLPVRDRDGAGVAAQLLLRLPHAAGPARLADEVARAWSPARSRSTAPPGAPAVAAR